MIAYRKCDNIAINRTIIVENCEPRLLTNEDVSARMAVGMQSVCHMEAIVEVDSAKDDNWSNYSDSVLLVDTTRWRRAT